MTCVCTLVFFFNDTATTEIYTLSLHDALPIWRSRWGGRSGPPPPSGSSAALRAVPARSPAGTACRRCTRRGPPGRSEEHTSELQSRQYLVCRLLLEKKKNIKQCSSY